MSSKTDFEANVHIRWMIRRDMSEVLEIEKSSFEFPWSEEDFIRCLRQRNCIGMVAEFDDRVVVGVDRQIFCVIAGRSVALLLLGHVPDDLVDLELLAVGADHLAAQTACLRGRARHVGIGRARFVLGGDRCREQRRHQQKGAMI